MLGFPLSPPTVSSESIDKPGEEPSCEPWCHLLLWSPVPLKPVRNTGCSWKNRPDWRTPGKGGKGQADLCGRSPSLLGHLIVDITSFPPSHLLCVWRWHFGVIIYWSRLMKANGWYTSSRGHKQKLWVVHLPRDKLRGLLTEGLFLFSPTCIASLLSVLSGVCGCWSRRPSYILKGLLRNPPVCSFFILSTLLPIYI